MDDQREAGQHLALYQLDDAGDHEHDGEDPRIVSMREDVPVGRQPDTGALTPRMALAANRAEHSRARLWRTPTG